MAWPADYADRVAGRTCEICREGRPRDGTFGTLVASTTDVDTYLPARGVQRGYLVVVWRGGHVVEPYELPEDRASGYWNAVARAGAAVQQHYEALKINYETLGNSEPHLHTHVTARYLDGDVDPGHPLPITRKTDLVDPNRDLDVLALAALLSADVTPTER